MTLKSYLWGTRLLTLFSFVFLGLVVNYVDPEKSGWAGRILFYLILFFALSGLINLSLLWARRKTLGSEIAALHLGLSLRQGMLLSLLAVGLLFLQSFRILVWWDGLLVLAGIFLIELYFLSKN